jgi:bifunctional UDP-N-acetylglucosamine pyrophosphorylase/glucosamine-1-phosphate N-acetyltransferase
MKVVLLAAGNGKRMGRLTAKFPKPLLTIGGIPIILRTLSILPSIISEVIIVLGYKSEEIISALRQKQFDFNITYVKQLELKGTAAAVHVARAYVYQESSFMVLCGDDLYHQKDLEYFVDHKLAYGMFQKKRTTSDITSVLHEDGYLTAIHGSIRSDLVWTGVGAYMIPQDFFSVTQFQLPNGELSLPHTLAQLQNVKVVEFSKWHQINTPEQLHQARKINMSLW